MKKCQVLDCQNNVVARGLCLKHYRRFRRTGLPTVPEIDRTLWTPENIAWVAGIVEGEGNICYRPCKTAGRLRVRMTDKDVLDKLYDITKIGVINGPYYRKNPKHKPSWDWCVNKKRHLVAILQVILPWLCSRRKNNVVKLLEKIVR